MATAGDGPSSYERGGGGAGGKFRKRPFRRPQSTPYDRPPTALRNPRNGGWLSKLVDPASKLISASAHMFFSSVFRKRLPAPPQPSPGANQESRDMLPMREVVVPNNPARAQELVINDGGNPSNSSDSSGISELEQMLKQKTFSRSEIDRLTELLRSRTDDLPVGNEDKKIGANLPNPISGFERHEGFTSSPMRENGIENRRLHGVVSTPVVSSRVLEEDVASPAELAKAYMGSRPSKVSPSMLGLRSQALREDATLLNNVPFPPKSPVMSLAPKSAPSVGVSGNGFITPRSRGRSAIYSMARTPYSRVYSMANQKGAGSTNDGFGGPSSSSQFAWEHNGHFGSKQVALKRRSSVLDDDIGSVGPIRRIRQKPNLLSPKNLGLPVSGRPLYSHAVGAGSDAAQHPISSTQKLLLLDESKHKFSKMLGENEDNSIRGTSFPHVPSKSTETATKILHYLETLTPKEKSSESKLAAARDKSPAKLTPSMLSGKALRSLEDMDSSKFLLNAQDSRKLEDSHNTSLPDARDSTSQKQDKVEENGPNTMVVPCGILFPAVNRVDTTVSVKDTVPNFEKADSATANFVSQPPQKKRAFQMSAHEDSLELDDDVHSNGDVSILSAEGREKLETPVVESKANATEAATVNKNPALSEVKPPAGSVLNKRTDFETNDGSVASEKGTSFTFLTASAPSMTLQPALLTPQSTPAFDKIVPPKETNVPPPLFSFGPKNVDKIQPVKFSSSSSVGESSGPKSSTLSDPKLESSNSFANVASGAADAVVRIPESDKGDSKNTQKAGDVIGKSETVFSSSVSTSTSGIFSFGAPANNSSLNNGSLSSSPSLFSSSAPVLPSSNLVNQLFSNSSIDVASSTPTTPMTSTSTPAPTTTDSNSSLTTSVAETSFSAAPIFRFGSSVAPSTSVSTVSTSSGVQNADSNVNTEKETTFGNITGSPFGGASSAMASTGSSIFGFSASATSSTAINQPQGSLFGTGSGSLGGTQASPAGTGIATVTQTMPVQFGSSASSPIFGSIGTTFTSSSSLFGSSTPAAKLFSSGSSFGLSSAASSSETTSISSSSGATSSLFGTSWQPTKSSIFGSSSSSSLFNNPSPSTGFSFGASSTSVAATNNAPPMVFGSSTGASSGSVFSFASAVANTSFSQTQPVFGNTTSVFTASSGNSDQMNMEDSMAEDPVQASTPAVPVFAQSPISPPSGIMFGSSAPSAALPFQFGGQQNQATPQNPSPFQASGSLEFSAGGSFSLGAGGDKSNRKMVRVTKHRNRKK